MTVVAVLALILLVVAAALSMARVVRPASLADRVVGLDTLLLVVANGLGVQAAWTRDGIFLDVMLVTTLLGFLGTVAVARYIEQRSTRG